MLSTALLSISPGRTRRFALKWMFAVKGALGPSGQVVIEKTISDSTVTDAQGEKTRCFEGGQARQACAGKEITPRKKTKAGCCKGFEKFQD